ncbi:PCRF domain-containing protein, partial [bacterium]|nr:PCRF domain-containing protein [bacterium]
MIKKLQEIQAHYTELEQQLADPQIASKPELSKPLLKELKELTPVVKYAHQLMALQKRAEEATLMLKEPDEDMQELAHQELLETQSRIVEVEDKIKGLLMPQDPHDNRNAILEIRAGTGGEEAALFAADLLRMYTRFIERHKWKQEYLTLS